MQTQHLLDRKKTNKQIRLRITTNRNLRFMTAVRTDATISDLANRALTVYLELSGEARASAGNKKQVTVSAVKQGSFYMPKSELVGNLLKCDDQVEVIIVNAKPKYPNQVFKRQSSLLHVGLPTQIAGSSQLLQSVPSVPRPSCKKQRKRQKMKEKRRQNNSETIAIMQPVEQQIIRVLQAIDSKQAAHEKEQYSDIQPSKKVKTDRQDVFNSPRKLLPIPIASPNFALPNEPQIDSPPFSLLSDFIHKKITREGQPRRPIEQMEKKSVIEKIVSPTISLKSPLFLNKPSPQNVPNSQPQGVRSMEPESFLLAAQLIDGTQIPHQNEKDSEHPGEQGSAEGGEGASRKQLPNVKGEANGQKQSLKSQKQMSKTVEANGRAKTGQKGVVLEAEESESEERWGVGDYCKGVHRQKELTEISHKMSSFLIDSEEEG